jgi:hypothetical protein
MTADFERQRDADWTKTLAGLAGHQDLPRLAALGWRFVGEAEERQRILASFYRRYGADPVMPAFLRDDGDTVLVLLPFWAASGLRPVMEISDYAAATWARTGAWRDVADWIAARLAPPEASSRQPIATFEEIIGLIQDSYAQREAVFVQTEDVLHWAIDLALEPAALLDRIAAHLVEGFHQGALDYDYCDVVANAFFTPALDLCADESFAWDTYLAFDDGEHSHGGTSEDPVADYTRPAVAALFARLQARSGETA